MKFFLSILERAFVDTVALKVCVDRMWFKSLLIECG